MTPAVAPALQRALRSQRWSAGYAVNTAVLAGWTVDGRTDLVTDIGCLLGQFKTLTVQTRLPLMYPIEQAASVRALLSAINAVAGEDLLVISVDGAPIVDTRRILVDDEHASAAIIIDAVKRNRQHAASIHEPMQALRTGTSTEDAIHAWSATAQLPFTKPVQRGTPFDLAGLPTTDDVLDDPPAGLPPAQAESLRRYSVLQRAHRTAPLCTGPVTTHADGVIECYGCDASNDRVHPGGVSLDCSPIHRDFGIGHRCTRCSGA